MDDDDDEGLTYCVPGMADGKLALCTVVCVLRHCVEYGGVHLYVLVILS